MSSVMLLLLLSAILTMTAKAPLAYGLDNGLALQPILGWNTWMTCDDTGCGHDQCSEQMVKEAATAMQENGMQNLGWRYVNLDDCWAFPRNESTGELRWDPERFPSGSVHGEKHDFGERSTSVTLDREEEHDPKSRCSPSSTCFLVQSIFSYGRPMAIPGSEGHFDQDARTFASWGVDFVKFDWCGNVKKQIWKGPKYHKEWAKGPGGWANMDFLQTGGQGCSAAMAHHTKGSHCPGMTDAEYRTEFSIWSLTQSPLIVDTDVRNMTAVMKAALLNEEILEIHQSTDTPPGEFLAYWPCSEPTRCQVWGRKLNESAWLVALTNLGRKAHKISLDFSHLDWTKSDRAVPRDVWAHGFLEPAVGAFTSEVASHDTTLVILAKNDN
eukprot:jgi/Bigna1/70198/fgenesh1_pg.11_\